MGIYPSNRRIPIGEYRKIMSGVSEELGTAHQYLFTGLALTTTRLQDVRHGETEP